MILPALLRAVAVALAVALLLDAPAGRRRPVPPLGALDVSASWTRARGTTLWEEATRRARGIDADSLLLVGDSVRVATPPATPTDAATRARPLVERALAAGRPLRLVTDGELDDPAALEALPAGSEVIVLSAATAPDAAVLDVAVPRAVIAGDTAEVSVTVGAGAAGAGAGTLELFLGNNRVASVALDSLGSFAERSVALHARLSGVKGDAILRAVVATGMDQEARNDTASVVIELSEAAGAVLVSTSPDYDARDALSVLRGALALPTRGYYRIAPGVWRVEGTLAPATEAEVRRAIGEAPLVILHGDTALFGNPRTITRGALALIAPPAQRDEEWYATGAPPSPMSSAMSGVPWDSLPPLEVAERMPSGDWEGIETRRARRLERRPAVVGTERPRRTVVVGASGFWRWRFRGGASADAYATMWGSIFDWLSEERSDARPAIPADGVTRAGEPLRWRRGSATDSVIPLVLTRRGDASAPDTVRLRFGPAENLLETPPQPPGIYDVGMPGGRATLVVNASRELLPRRSVVTAGPTGRGASLGDAPHLRNAGWVFVAILLALSLEWIVRRRLGLR